MIMFMKIDESQESSNRQRFNVLSKLSHGQPYKFHVMGAACVLVLVGASMRMDTFADNHATTITLQDLGVLQLVAHDLFDVKRGDGVTAESAADFENGKLDLSTLFMNTTSGDYFDDETVARGGEVRNRENVMMFTVSSDIGQTYLDFLDAGDSREVARQKTLAIYHEMFATSYNNAFGEQIPEKRRGQATPDGNIALRTVHDFLPGRITANGALTELLSMPPSMKLSDSDMMQQSSPLDGQLDEEFFAIDISHPDGPVITVNLLEADQSFGDQFDTKFSFDELLEELVDGKYDTDDKAMGGIRDLISGAYPETYHDQTGSVISISSTNVHGLYLAGEVITITAEFLEDVQITGITNTAGQTLPFILLDTTPPARALYKDLAGQTMTFEYAVGDGQYSPDLEYAGTGALHIDPGMLQYLDGSSVPTTLPQPGNVGSLSYDKNIRIGMAPPPNDPPTVDAGAKQTVQEGDAVTLEGTATDREGDSLTYMWTHDSGLPIALADDMSLSTTFTAPALAADTTITFTLTVSDGINADVTDQVIIVVANNDPPTVNAGIDQTVQEGDAVTLEGTATDREGDSLTYMWTHDSGLPIALADDMSLSTTFTAPALAADTTITFTLTVSDGINADVTDQVKVAVTGTATPLVRGTVFSDADGDGIQDPGELGIEDYTMLAIDLADPEDIRSSTTDADGTYSFEVAPYPETTMIQTGFFPQGHTVIDVESSWFSYVAPQEGQTETFDVGFYPVPQHERTTLDLTIFLDENRNGIMDDGEGGVEGISFTVYTYTIGPETVTTDADGTVTKTDLVPADWAVTDLPEDYLVTAYSYERSDGTEGKQYDPNLLLADDPEPGSVHTMMIGFTPSS